MAEESNTSQEVDLSKVILTEQDVKDAGLDHRFVGQPATVLKEQHLKARGIATTASQDKAALEKEVTSLKASKADPPPSLDPLQYSAAETEKYEQILMDAIDKRVDERVSKVTAPIQADYKKNQDTQILSDITGGLPEGVEVLDAVKAWGVTNNVSAKQYNQMVAAGNTEVLINSIINHANMAYIQANQTETDKVAGLKQTQNATKVVQHTKASSLNSQQRNKSKEDSIAGRIGEKLEKNAVLQNPQKQ